MEKQNEINKRIASIRKQSESNKRNKTNLKKTKKENKRDDDINLSRFFELTSSDKTYVIGINLHEFEIQIILDYTEDFALSGSMVLGPFEHKTNIRFRIRDDFQSYIKA